MAIIWHNGEKVEFDSPSELGEKAARFAIPNPYEPMTFEYNAFNESKWRERDKIKNGD